jgi:hypothetical protein
MNPNTRHNTSQEDFISYLLSGATGQCTLREIDFLATFLAYVLFVKFIGKNFDFLGTTRTLAGKRFQIFELFITGAMLGC